MGAIGASATDSGSLSIKDLEDLHGIKIQALVTEAVWVVQCTGLLASNVLLVATQFLGAGLCSKEIEHGISGLLS
jgi:hypothetical protein